MKLAHTTETIPWKGLAWLWFVPLWYCWCRKCLLLSLWGVTVLKISPVFQPRSHDDIDQIATLRFMPGFLSGMCPLSTLDSLELKSKQCLFCEDSEIKIKQITGLWESRKITVTRKYSLYIHFYFAHWRECPFQFWNSCQSQVTAFWLFVKRGGSSRGLSWGL